MDRVSLAELKREAKEVLGDARRLLDDVRAGRVGGRRDRRREEQGDQGQREDGGASHRATSSTTGTVAWPSGRPGERSVTSSSPRYVPFRTSLET